MGLGVYCNTPEKHKNFYRLAKILKDDFQKSDSHIPDFEGKHDVHLWFHTPKINIISFSVVITQDKKEGDHFRNTV